MWLEKDLEKIAIETLEAHGIMAFKTPKFSDRKHKQRDCDLGAPDLWIFTRGKCFALELKSEGGRQSDVQKAFERRLKAHGIQYFICYSLDDIDNLIAAIIQS